jgi:hypothetical protein
MKPGMSRVATFNEADKAEVVKNRLQQAGINAAIVDESKLEKYFYMSKPLASQKVYVEDKDLRRAREFLEDADRQDHILNSEVRCVQCGSVRVEYPQFPRKFITTTFVELFCFLGIIDKTFFCKDCHHTWPVKVTLRPKIDRLNWPVPHEGMVRQEKG